MADTIAAVATAPGRGGIGIVRVSGSQAFAMAARVCGCEPGSLQTRHAVLRNIRDDQGQIIDRGLILPFRGPHSFTGEDVIEFQCHGGPVLMDLLLRHLLALGARLARPGEFSERAFHNDKLDLVQAEAIADLITASTEQAARSALQSLQGAFSHRIDDLLEALITLRLHVEAAIDFPEEEIDFLADGQIADQLARVIARVDAVQAEARQGQLLREGMKVVIAGSPNAGKSSLLNALAGVERAIVTDVPGTTRDVLREQIQIHGMPLHVIDTAGLRETPDRVEQEGIRRAQAEISQADRVLFVWDSADASADPEHSLARLLPAGFSALTLIANQCDRSGREAGLQLRELSGKTFPEVVLSARTGAGLDTLRLHLTDCMGLQTQDAGVFSARTRHVDALQRTALHLQNASIALHERHAGELMAEDLRLAQNTLSEITGIFSPDDLLGRIFSSFCIGK